LASQINASNSGFGGIVSTGDSSGELQLQAAGTTALTIDTSQKVLVNTTTARANFFNSTSSPILQVEGTSFNTSSYSAIRNSNDTSSPFLVLAKSRGTIVGSNTIVQSGDSPGQISFQGNDGTEFVEAARITSLIDGTPGANDMPGSLTFGTTADGASSPTERMRIDSSGNVQIGKTSNSTLSAGINLGSLPNFIASTASPSDGPYMQISNIAASVANGFRYISFRVGSSGNEAGSISTNGSSTVSYVTSSDYRLKENVKPMVGALDVISKLNPVTYTWKIDGSDGQGFIAHELQEVVPDAVTGKKDAVDEEGNIKPQGVDTSFLVATLTAAIQEQQTIINNLKARIETLEAK
jgi:hypothetical protein